MVSFMTDAELIAIAVFTCATVVVFAAMVRADNLRRAELRALDHYRARLWRAEQEANLERAHRLER